MIKHRFRAVARLMAVSVAGLVAALLVGGCISVNPKPPAPQSSSGDSIDHPAHPLSDDDAKAQVVGPAREIVSVAQLQGMSADFAFTSCNDQGDPPYMGKLEIVFDLPPNTNADQYFQKIIAEMSHAGWTINRRYTLGPKTLDKGNVTADIGPLPLNPAKGLITVTGECRNMTDHHHDGKTNSTDVTAEVQ
jgi:hypothetical protein